MLYTYKLPNGVLRLSDKAEYFADASDAYHSLAKVRHLHCSSQSLVHPVLHAVAAFLHVT